MKISRLISERSKPFFSLEFFPPADEAKMPEFLRTAAELEVLKPLFVSVTYGAGGAKQRNTLSAALGLARKNLVVMPHLTCVGATPQGIDNFLNELQSHGIDNVLALRGDAPKDKSWEAKDSYFKYAVDLVRYVKVKAPDMGIGVAAYPFPHPESPTFESDRIYTARKFVNGADFAITQLFFDVREYVDLVERLKKSGINIPIIPGIITIQSLAALKRVLSLCGAQIPAKFYLRLEEANEGRGQEKLREVGVDFAINQIRQLLDYGAPGIHLYTLNKSDLCKRIIEETGLVGK